MSKHGRREAAWEPLQPSSGGYGDEGDEQGYDEQGYEDEGFSGPRRRASWWSGKHGVVGALCLVGFVALGFTVFGVAKGETKSAAYPRLPDVVAPNAGVPTTSVAEQAAEAEAAREIVVSVVGAVRKPGLARLLPGSRVADALEAAGGLSAEAEASALNLAQRLEDGDQVVVGALATGVTPVAAPPARPPQAEPPPSAPRQSRPLPRRPQRPPALPRTSRCDCAGSRAPGSSQLGRRQVDVNAATEGELDTVPGIGKGIARAILRYRAEHGRIRSVGDLAKIKQIGAGRLKKLRPYLRV